MSKGTRTCLKRKEAGFTLIELLVVVLVIGILAAIAVPQYFKVVEKGKFAETMQWVNGVKGAQERYLARNGLYFSGALNSTTFDANLGNMVHYGQSSVSSVTAPSPSWQITLTRNGSPCPAVYGCYIVTYSAPPGVITCTGQCQTDLAPN